MTQKALKRNMVYHRIEKSYFLPNTADGCFSPSKWTKIIPWGRGGNGTLFQLPKEKFLGELGASEKAQLESELCCSEICAKQGQRVAKSIFSGTDAPCWWCLSHNRLCASRGQGQCPARHGSPAPSRGLAHGRCSVSPQVMSSQILPLFPILLSLLPCSYF